MSFIYFTNNKNKKRNNFPFRFHWPRKAIPKNRAKKEEDVLLLHYNKKAAKKNKVVSIKGTKKPAKKKTVSLYFTLLLLPFSIPHHRPYLLAIFTAYRKKKTSQCVSSDLSLLTACYSIVFF